LAKGLPYLHVSGKAGCLLFDCRVFDKRGPVLCSYVCTLHLFNAVLVLPFTAKQSGESFSQPVVNI